MADVLTPSPFDTLADLWDALGRIPPDRIRFRPSPGTATERDVLRVEREENRLCELVDGVLVEKPMGFRESLLAMALGAALREFAIPNNLGLVAGPDGMLRLFPGLVRIPDVAFVAWESLPGGVPVEPIPELAPDLAIEVLSRTNTVAEMDRKRREYFDAGVKLLWIVDPDERQVTVFRSCDEASEHGEHETIDGGSVLPGFRLSLADLFAELDRRPGPASGPRAGESGLARG